MLCDKCGKNEATVFFKQVINNKETTQHLCNECAEGIMDIGNFSLDKFFSGSHLNSPFESTFGGFGGQVIKCPVCGMTYADFSQTGKLGCSECYRTFEDRILPMVKSIHGKNLHNGKSKNVSCAETVAERGEKAIAENESKFYEKIALQKQLRELVKAERFEEAAKVRDEIKRIDDELSNAK